jgi:hypothetical protein
MGKCLGRKNKKIDKNKICCIDVSMTPESPHYTGDGTPESPLRLTKGFRAFREAVGKDFSQRVWEGESVNLNIDGWTFTVTRIEDYPDEICVYPGGLERSPSEEFNLSHIRTVAQFAQFIHAAFVNNFHKY